MQNQQLTERIARLESRLEAANGKAAERGATTEQVAALQRQLKTAAAQLAEMQGVLAASRQRAQADAAALAARDSELANMHLAMGELAYEAQAASSSQLQVHRLQVRTCCVPPYLLPGHALYRSSDVEQTQ